jgi:hypothetical protein
MRAPAQLDQLASAVEQLSDSDFGRGWQQRHSQAQLTEPSVLLLT